MTRTVTRRWRRAHPRVGGENFDEHSRQLSRHGSSPRGRGKRGGWPRTTRRRRLIPAWAGKTKPLGLGPIQAAAHPRVGGENPVPATTSSIEVGSSPRGRGKLSGDWQGVWDGRLIPAWAGKTTRDRPPPRHPQAHPRVGGENQGDQLADAASLGSSPRGRGKPRRLDPRNERVRLIPAWAGKTAVGPVRGVGCQAHPRVGGENAPRSAASLTRCWLIPAWAGKTT